MKGESILMGGATTTPEQLTVTVLFMTIMLFTVGLVYWIITKFGGWL